MKIVIISQNQKDFISQISSTLRADHVFVFDRCTDGSEQEAERLCVRFLVNKEGEGRQCSRARNMGAEFFPCDDILFLDGDRIPLFLPAELEASPFDVTLIKCQTDSRKADDGKPNPQWGKYHNGCFSSAIFIRRTAIDAVKQKYGHLFDESFTRWGEEDRHLGDLLWAVGATCGYALPHNTVQGGVGNSSDYMDDFKAMTRLRADMLIAYGLNSILDSATET